MYFLTVGAYTPYATVMSTPLCYFSNAEDILVTLLQGWAVMIEIMTGNKWDQSQLVAATDC